MINKSSSRSKTSPKKRLKLKPVKKIEKELKKEWPLKVRERVTLLHGTLSCERCGSNSYLNAHHIYGKKAYPAGKYRLDNGVLICGGCHFIAHHKQEEFRIWLIPYLGDGSWETGESVLYELRTSVQGLFQFRRGDEVLVREEWERQLETYRKKEPQTEEESIPA